MNTNALNLCNSCLPPYEIHVHIENPAPLWERLLHTGSGVDFSLVPAESNQGNIFAKLGLILMAWAQMLAEGTSSKSHQRWLIGCELWSLTISWEAQNFFRVTIVISKASRKLCGCVAGRIGKGKTQGKYCLCHKG